MATIKFRAEHRWKYLDRINALPKEQNQTMRYVYVRTMSWQKIRIARDSTARDN